VIGVQDGMRLAQLFGLMLVDAAGTHQAGDQDEGQAGHGQSFRRTIYTD